MSEKSPVLNLDDIFGMGAPIRVQWKTVEYELPRPEAFSPRAWSGFAGLQSKIAMLQSFGENLTDEQAKELDTVVSACIEYLSPKLAKQDLPFYAKVQVIKYYGQQVSPDGSSEAKNSSGSPTGETPSVGSASGTD